MACFGSTSGKHGKAMTRPKKPDILPNCSKKVMIRCYCTQIQPNDQDIVVILGQCIDITGFQDSRHGFWLANSEFGYGNMGY